MCHSSGNKAVVMPNSFKEEESRCVYSCNNDRLSDQPNTGISKIC